MTIRKLLFIGLVFYTPPAPPAVILRSITIGAGAVVQ
jgi:hypothetical protein